MHSQQNLSCIQSMKHILRETHFPASQSWSHLDSQTVPTVIDITALCCNTVFWEGEESVPVLQGIYALIIKTQEKQLQSISSHFLCCHEKPNQLLGKWLKSYFQKLPKMPTSIMKSLSKGVTSSLQMILQAKHHKIIKPFSKRSQTMCMWVGKIATDKKIKTVLGNEA